MTFDWDVANVEHIARHGITPVECEEAYRNGPMIIDISDGNTSAAGSASARLMADGASRQDPVHHRLPDVGRTT
jgi:hypothetical protein